MKIRTVIKQPGHKPAVLLMENSLEGLQRFVGGQIETIEFMPNCLAIHNHDGKKLGMKKNMNFLGNMLNGPVVFVGIDGDTFCGLTEDQAQTIMMIVK